MSRNSLCKAICADARLIGNALSQGRYLSCFRMVMVAGMLSLLPGVIKAQLAPSAVYQSSIDRLVVFVVTNGHLFDKFWNGSAWQWEDQGLPPGTFAATAPSAVYQSSIDRLVVFVAGSNGNLFDKFTNGPVWQWEDQGPF